MDCFRQSTRQMHIHSIRLAQHRSFWQVSITTKSSTKISTAIVIILPCVNSQLESMRLSRDTIMLDPDGFLVPILLRILQISRPPFWYLVWMSVAIQSNRWCVQHWNVSTNEHAWIKLDLTYIILHCQSMRSKYYMHRRHRSVMRLLKYCLTIYLLNSGW